MKRFVILLLLSLIFLSCKQTKDEWCINNTSNFDVLVAYSNGTIIVPAKEMVYYDYDIIGKTGFWISEENSFQVYLKKIDYDFFVIFQEPVRECVIYNNSEYEAILTEVHGYLTDKKNTPLLIQAHSKTETKLYGHEYYFEATFSEEIDRPLVIINEDKKQNIVYVYIVHL